MAQHKKNLNTAAGSQAKLSVTWPLSGNRSYWIIRLPPRAANFDENSFGVSYLAIETGCGRPLPGTNPGSTTRVG